MSIVVPVFGGPETFGELLSRVHQVFRDGLPGTVEVIFVDDASPNPSTWRTIEQLAASAADVRGLQLTRNAGRPAAVLAGLSAARGTHVVVMDDDLQHRPEAIPTLLAAADHDVVIARFLTRHDALIARVGSRFRRVLDRRLGVPPEIVMGSFLVLRRRIVDEVLRLDPAPQLIPEAVFRVTRDAVNVDVEHAPRAHGRPAYTLARRLGLFARFTGRAMLTLLGPLGRSWAAAKDAAAGRPAALIGKRTGPPE